MKMQSLLLVVGLLTAAGATADVREEERHSFTLESGGRLSLENVNGAVSVVGGGGNQVEIVAYKEADNQEALDEIEIDIDATPTRISVDTQLPKSRGWWGGNSSGASVRYEVSVPTNIDLDGISSVNGDIDIRGVFGAIKAETVNGDIEIQDASSDANLETVNGTIDARFSSVTGDQRIDCDTVNGRINLSLPDNSDARFAVETVNGSIDGDDFGMEVDKGFVGRSLDGKVGDGSARVSANTVNGGVKIRKQ